MNPFAFLWASNDQEPTPLPADGLTRFLFGQLSKEEEEVMLEALVGSAQLRVELLALHERLSTEAVAALAEDPTVGQSVRSAVLETLQSLVPPGRVPNHVFQSIGQEWRRLFAVPRFATVRDVDDTIGIRGTERKVRLQAEIVGSELQITLDPGGQPVSEALTLSLRDPGGSMLRLWQGTLGADPMSLRFENAGVLLGFDQGPVAAVVFSLSVHEADSDTGGTIAFELRDGQRLRLALTSPLIIQANRMRLEVDVSSLVRQEDWSVQLLLRAGTVDLQLASMVMKTSDDVLLIESVVPPMDSLEIGGTSLLRLRQS